LRFAIVSANVDGAMSRALAILAALALPVRALAGELTCPAGAELRGQRPPAGLRQWCEDEQHRQHGPTITWDAQHRQRLEAYFEHGAMQGSYKSWHENGQLGILGAYVDDRREGVWEAWYPDGARARSQEYRGGQQHGTAKEWYPNGQLRYEEHYSRGERHGPAVAYYENGQKQSEGSFDRGAFDGTWTGWYEDGSTRKVAVYRRGVKTKEQEFPRAN
jgi:antitoxin component YwqK of YwqJK toxin-antitoxin module